MPVDLWRLWTTDDPDFPAFVYRVAERACELRKEANSA